MYYYYWQRNSRALAELSMYGLSAIAELLVTEIGRNYDFQNGNFLLLSRKRIMTSV